MRHYLYLACVLLAACGSPQPPLVASDVEITRPMPGRHMSAGYFVLTNTTDSPIRITAAASPQFGMIEMHETTIEDGIARMREIEELVVPANSSVTFERGGKHLMLMRAQNVEQNVSLQLFSDDAPVLSIDYAFPDETK